MSKKNKQDNQNTQSLEGETPMSSNFLSNTSATSAVAEPEVVPVSSSFVKPVVSSSATPTKIVTSSTPIPMKIDTSSTVKVAPAPKVNTNVTKLDTIIKEYETATENDKLTGKLNAITVFINMCEYLNRCNDPSVFESFYKYFLRTKDTYMHYETALNGIHTIQNKDVKTRVSATHAAFVELVRVRSTMKGVYHFTANAMRGMRISDNLTKWIIEKSRNRY